MALEPAFSDCCWDVGSHQQVAIKGEEWRIVIEIPAKISIIVVLVLQVSHFLLHYYYTWAWCVLLAASPAGCACVCARRARQDQTARLPCLSFGLGSPPQFTPAVAGDLRLLVSKGPTALPKTWRRDSKAMHEQTTCLHSVTVSPP